MISFTFRELAEITGGELVQLDFAATTRATPAIDSRTIATAGRDTFFCAFKGESIDGNLFAESAIAAGAEFVLTESDLNLPSIKVENVLEALTKLASAARRRLSAKVIGITGSQGKTTTKEMLRAILETQGRVVSPPGSFNNEIGVPLTLLNADETTDFVIVEMGARHTGDIAHLTDIAAPHVGVVLVVGTAHLGEFGSIEKLAATKAELINHLADGATAILGDYDSYTPTFGAGRDLTRIIFGEQSRDAVRAADVELRGGRAHFDLVAPDGRAAVSLKILGAHHIANALAAAAVAHALGLAVESSAVALSEAELTTKWRMELHEVSGVSLINDAYNANPESMAAALVTTSLMAQESGGLAWAFLGKMHELGASEVERHREIGRLASRLHIDQLVQVGEVNFLPSGTTELDGMAVTSVANVSEAMKIAKFIQPGDVVLVKASRAEGLEKLAEELIAFCEVLDGTAIAGTAIAGAAIDGTEVSEGEEQHP